MATETENTSREAVLNADSFGSALSGERILEGAGVAPGIAIGPVYLYTKDAFTIVQRQLTEDEIEPELERFERAVPKAERELNKIAAVAREKLGPESAEIFEAQAMMLRDELLYTAVVEHIREERVSADFTVQSVMSKHRQLMKASENEYLRERANDLLDVQDRIIRHLRRGKILSAVDADTIVVAENLTAADIILFSRRNILGCAMDFGGATSHVSIMARALNVPAVVGLHEITDQVSDGDLLILDGLSGRVIINPTDETIERYRQKQQNYAFYLKEQKHMIPLPAETPDGHRVVLRANLEFKEELDLLREFGAEGVGLFRTEILFLMQGRISFTEEEQFQSYKKITESVSPNVTTFRELDQGGDKEVPLAQREQNPFLGWRGIRILNEREELLRPQLRALLRASAYGPTRIMLPMVTQLQEVYRFKEALAEVSAELDREGIEHDRSIKVGIMVEVPSVSLMAEKFAGVCDFFSIGSNDLTQYVLAVDRGNDLVSSLYDELHPAVLMLIKQTVDAARKAGISVSLCGEVAANPYAVPILVGLGLDELSVSPRYLPEVKRIIRSIKLSEAQALTSKALAACSAEEVTSLVKEWMRERSYIPSFYNDALAG